MNDQLEHPLRTVSMRVLSDWAMTLADEVNAEESPFDPAKPLYMAWVDVEGCVSGALSIVAQDPFIDVILANVTGSSAEECTAEERADILREMSNVVAGNFFTEAFGEDCTFDLLNPNVTEVALDELDKIAQRRVKFYFVADDTPVAITFSVRK